MVLSFFTKIVMWVAGIISINWAIAGLIHTDIINKIVSSVNISYVPTIVYVVVGICGIAILIKYKK